MHQRDETTPESDTAMTSNNTWWRVVLRDLVLVTAWVAILSVAWGGLGWPLWVYYVVVFGGILGYTVASGAIGIDRGSSQ